MNANWQNFLLSQHAGTDANGDITVHGAATAAGKSLYPLSHLSVLSVAGKDAARFLQGQCTCDINAVSAAHSGIGAFCNAKGRAISTFLICKKDAEFLLLLPTVLADSVKRHLQRYILRAAVTIADAGEAYCLIGIGGAATAPPGYPLPQRVYELTQAGGDTLLYFPSAPPRYMLIAAADSAPGHWTTLCADGFKPAETAAWRHLDLDAGIPWLDLTSSEQFIPQMLNLDRLGGIGFSKGCYTGQEVVARTQYLGSVKRRMYLAECPATAQFAAWMNIIDFDSAPEAQAVGKLLAAQREEQTLHMLVVLQTANAGSKNLRLQNAMQDRISVKPLSYVTETAQ
jgi:folate-binding protein YgfZ